MLKHRVLTAFILIPLALLALFFLPLPYFAGIIIVLCAIGMWEWTQFLGIKSGVIKAVIAVLMGAVLAGLYYGLPSLFFNEIVLYSFGLALVWWILALYLVITYPKSAVLWRDHIVMKTVFGVCTLFPFFTAMVQLRSNYEMSAAMSALLVLYVLVLIWATDSGAYFVGRVLGKHKLAPAVSPGKTIEGLIGGVALASVLAWIINSFFFPWSLPLWQIGIVSFIAILASVLGDLTESMFKRAAGIKDSGQLIPGHGGILDRLDSLMAAAPIFAALFLFIK